MSEQPCRAWPKVHLVPCLTATQNGDVNFIAYSSDLQRFITQELPEQEGVSLATLSRFFFCGCQLPFECIQVSCVVANTTGIQHPNCALPEEISYLLWANKPYVVKPVAGRFIWRNWMITPHSFTLCHLALETLPSCMAFGLQSPSLHDGI